ncbi:MAG: T9SS type A sorting domain-containing protein [Chitinophagia bacterium]
MSKSSGYSTPILITGDNCFKVSNNISKFWASKKGEFFASCVVDLDYIKLSIKITPNPVITYANIKFLNVLQNDNKYTVVVFNNSGQPALVKEVSQEAFLAGYKLDMTSLASGYYFIQIGSSTILQTFKILKN